MGRATLGVDKQRFRGLRGETGFADAFHAIEHQLLRAHDAPGGNVEHMFLLLYFKLQDWSSTTMQPGTFLPALRSLRTSVL